MTQNNIIFTTLAAAIISFGAMGFLAAHAEDHSKMKHSHDHSKLVSLPEGATAPTIDINVKKDTVGGWNLHIMTENFRFAPEVVNQDHKPGEGHAHIYVNGKKLARIYGSWFHIGSLPKGTVEVTVTLNANDHGALAVGKKALSATTNILVE